MFITAKAATVLGKALYPTRSRQSFHPLIGECGVKLQELQCRKTCTCTVHRPDSALSTVAR